jgi:hypothetical protein
MTLQELRERALQLSIDDRRQLIHTLLESLQPETRSTVWPKNLSRLRGIAKSTEITENTDPQKDYKRS